MSGPGYARFVAIGDSTTEGLMDPRPDGTFRGWADRLAQRLDGLGHGFQYANLAIRGRKVDRIVAEQLEPAMAMEPDLASVIAGVNDILRPKVDVDHVAAQMERMVQGLRAGGATVLMMTYPDPSVVLPMARVAKSRVLAFNEALREIAARREARLMDFGRDGVGDARLWAADRLHANSQGHERIARAAAELLGLPGADGSWREPLDPAARAPLAARVGRELAWTGRHLAPWVGRRLRGRSSGDTVSPKQPRLAPLAPE
jgi:lysophospholipase L1-like esterase